jgi:eukaryotic-like serine/threonine-protein kinase
MSTSPNQSTGELYEFGPFQVNPKKEILLRAGKPVPLTPRTFQILLVLVRHSKEVVTKDDLMKAVWPDTFVEEANLSRNIFMLRKALGESPQDHRYILTVPGRGYRLVEEARLVSGPDLGVLAASHSKVQVQVAETKPWGWIALAAAAGLVLTIGAALLFLRRTPVLSEKDSLVLADFSNSTGDPVFEGTLRQGLEVQLEQSPYLSLISDQRIRHTLRLMGRPDDAPLTSDLAREVCVRTGSAAVLEGSIAPIGSQYVLGLRATNCQTGAVLDEEQAQVRRKEDVLNALSRIASRFRTRAGESLAMVTQHNIPLPEATTPSLEALKAYSDAWRVAWTTGSAAAVPIVKRAIEIDPQFAMAHAYLGRLYGDIGESNLARENLTQAYQLRDRVSDRERFFITANYDRVVTGNLGKAREICELWARTYPRDPAPRSFLSGGISDAVGQYEKGAEEAEKTIKVDPDGPWGYVNLSFNDISLEHVKQAESALEQASERKLELPEILVAQYYIAFLKDDRSAMERVVALSQGKAGAEDWITDQEAFALAYSGRLQEARSTTKRAEDLAREAGDRERAAQYQAADAVRETLFGNTLQGRQEAMAAIALSKGRDVEYGAAIALAGSGDRSVAQSLANDLQQRFPDDTLVNFSYEPTIRALLALNDRKPSSAIQLLQTAAPYDLGVSSDSVGFVGALYPVYVRGLAYLSAHEGAQAATEFQKIIDHRGIVVSDPIGALAHLQLGRAYAPDAKSAHGAEANSDRAKARAAYQDFLTLWKNADSDIPVYQQAKAEYARLQ